MQKILDRRSRLSRTRITRQIGNKLEQLRKELSLATQTLISYTYTFLTSPTVAHAFLFPLVSLLTRQMRPDGAFTRRLPRWSHTASSIAEHCGKCPKFAYPPLSR